MFYQSNSNISFSKGTSANIAVVVASTSENPQQPQHKQTAQQLVRKNVQYLIEQLEAEHSEALTGFLRAMGVFRGYSLSNQLAIARQRPTASRVAGMYAWNQLGRYINNGQKGIAILAPVVGKRTTREEEKDKKGTILLGFRRVYVWDEEQTHGLPLPELEKVTGNAGVYLDRMREWVAAQGITLEYTEDISPALGMAYGTNISILPGSERGRRTDHAYPRGGASGSQARQQTHDHNEDSTRGGGRSSTVRGGLGHWHQRLKQCLVHPALPRQRHPSNRSLEKVQQTAPSSLRLC